MAYKPAHDSLDYAARVIETTYGDVVNIYSKGKFLTKFGRTVNADSGVRTTIAGFQGAVVNETHATTNSIDRVGSDAAGDTGTVTIEGHTIDGSGNLTFVTQTKTLTGTTPVILTTPLARCTRMYKAASGSFGTPATDLVGNIYVYDLTLATGHTGGVPTIATATKCMIVAGRQQSEKCATTISSTDYWIITSATISLTIRSGPIAKVEFQLETRDVANGGVWRPFAAEISLQTAVQDTIKVEYDPPYIVPKNHDFRTIAVSNVANAEVAASVGGYLAEIA